jgi:hypothetical protein
VPNSRNPQSFNRYTYVNNTPLNLIDPSGHGECAAQDPLNCTNPQPHDAPEQGFTSPYFEFVGEDMTIQEKLMAHEAAGDMAQRMARAANPMRRMLAKEEGIAYTPMSAEEVFLEVFDGPLTINKTSAACTAGTDCLAWVSPSTGVININKVTNPYLVIHEMFHVLDLIQLGGAANRALAAKQTVDSSFPNRPTLKGNSALTWGFAGGNFSDWQKSRSGLSGEEFADMGIGWTYNRWDATRQGRWTDDGRARYRFMHDNMPFLLNLAID